LSSIFDFAAQIEFGGIIGRGRGTDFCSETSIEKASAEAIERYLCKKLKMNSTGLSVSGRSTSVEHAMGEALERFYLFSHLDLKLPFIRCPDKLLEKLTLNSILREFEEKTQSVFVSFHQMATRPGDSGIVCFIEDTKTNIFSFGFSYGQNVELNLQRAFFEAVPNFIALKEAHELSSTAQSKLQEDTTLWHLSEDFHSQIMPLLFQDQPNQKSFFSTAIAYPSFEVTEIDIQSLGELKDCPIKPVRVSIKPRRDF
jgi:hypothetical protein